MFILPIMLEYGISLSTLPKMLIYHPNLKIMNFIDLLRIFFLPPSKRLQEIKGGEKVRHLYSASQLDEVGVKFKVGSSECLFDLKFTNEVLKIPCLTLYDETESLFQNLMAL
jgi:hypothetical protein